MEEPENPPPQSPAIVPNRVLKGKDGQEPFAEKVARAKETLRKYPIPEHLLKRDK